MLPAGAAAILRIRTWGTDPRRLLWALGATVLLCLVGACAGPGLEPPNDRDSQGSSGTGGSAAASGSAGVGGSGATPAVDSPPQDAGGDGDGDGDSPGGSDAGEAELDASVDDDGGTDPQDLEP